MRQFLVVSLAVGWIVCVLGCGSKGGSIPTIPVEGKVTVDGKAPAGPFLLLFTSQSADIPTINGIVKADGTFTMTTNKPDDGAPEGTYTVTTAPDALNPATTPNVKPITVKIAKPESGSVLPLEINLESAGPAGMMLSPLPKPGMEKIRQ
ncbi:MAG: hypothetical protein ACYC6N_06285 [Pirellulaceae bacterium]